MATHNKLRRVTATTAVVAGLGLAGAGLYPALASAGSPKLPETSAEELLVKVAEAEEQQLTGTVRVDAGMNVPGLETFAAQLGGPAGKLAGLATGSSTLRVAVDGPENQRLAISDGDEEFSVIHKGEDLWMYDETENVAYYATVPAATQEELDEAFEEGHLDLVENGLTPQESVRKILDQAGEHASITVDGTARVAGQDAYQLLIEPQDDGQAMDSARISVDAETGVPLAVTVFNGDRQLLDVAFSKISYDAPAGANFDFTPPQDAEVVDLNEADLAGMLPFAPSLSS